MRKGRNHYETLGVSRDADHREIRKAFRRKAKEYHPDSNTGGSTDAFRRAQEAYETLRDASTRKRYDRELEQRDAGIYNSAYRTARGAEGMDAAERAFANLWDYFFAAASEPNVPHEAKYREKREREPLDYTIHVTAAEARDGTQVSLPHEGRRPMIINVPPGVYHGQVITSELQDLFGRREIRLHIDIQG